jgi:galactitol-specific phosphotransferase system IIB component
MVGYADQMIELLEPKVGRSMATSAVKRVCKKQGIDMTDITQDQIGSLAESLRNPLIVFAGNEFADKIIQDMKKIR